MSVQTLKDRSQLQANVDEKLLNIAIKEFQELELKKLLGKAEYDRLQDAVAASVNDPDADPLSDDDKELMTYITPVMIYGSLVYSISPIHRKLTNAGVKEDEYQNSKSNDLAEARADYAFKLDGFKRDLVDYREEKAKENNTGTCRGAEDTTFQFTGMALPDSNPDVNKIYENRNYKTGGFGIII
jgi:hypothetical protein